MGVLWVEISLAVFAFLYWNRQFLQHTLREGALTVVGMRCVCSKCDLIFPSGSPRAQTVLYADDEATNEPITVSVLV